MRDGSSQHDMIDRIAKLEREVRKLRIEREKVAQALRESRHRSQKLLETIPDLMFVLSREGKILDFQANDATHLAMEKERVIGALLRDVMPPRVADLALQAVNSALEQNRLQLIEYQLPVQNAVLDFEARLAPLTNGSVLAIVRNITQQKVAERSLRRSEHKFRKLYERAPVGIFRTDARGRVLTVNSAMARMLGFDDPEKAVAFYSDLGAQLYTDRKVRKRFVRLLRQEGRVENFEYEARTFDRRHIWLNMSARLVAGTQDGRSVIEGFTTDVTQRKNAEESLAKRTEMMAAVLDNVPVMIDYFDRQGKLLLVNRCWEETFGWSQAEARDRNVWAEIYPDPRCREKIEEFIGAAEGTWSEFKAHTRDGRVIETMWANILLKDGSSIGIGLDITERKQNAREQRELQTQLTHAMQIANLGHWEYDVAENRFRFNDQFYRIFGTTAREVGGSIMSASEYAARFVHPEDRHIVSEEIQKAIDATDPDFKGQVEHRIRYADGSVGYIAVLFFVQKDAAGNTVKIYGVNQDITERKTIEARLLQAQKMESIGNLAGGIAHDFNNILFPIIGLSEMLMEDLPAETLERDSAREILEAGRRGSDLVKQILTFSRQNEQKMLPLHIQTILKEALKLCVATIPSDIAISSDIQQDCGGVMANPTQMHQVVMNLMTNAYHAIEPSPGEIRVALQEAHLPDEPWPGSTLNAGCYVQLSVADTGCGIAPAALGKIFEPYFTTKAPGKGTGLGLAVVYGIVQEHRGDIKVSSTVGEGTTFQVFLPLPDRLPEIETEESAKPLPTGTERILVIDDESAVVRLQRRMLESLGYRVSIRTDSLEGLHLFRRGPDHFDLVITDMTMPGLTGDRLAAALLEARTDIPIILCTGFSERITPQKAETIGIRGFLMKPVVKSQLAAAVRKVLDGASSFR